MHLHRLIIFLVVQLLAFHLTSQPITAPATGAKGATPIVSVQGGSTGKTYAVVIGVSDYQDKAIPDLRFAVKDAEAFAKYLASDAGGSLPQEQMKVLFNQNATTAQMVSALDWLIEVSGEGDQCIIYFSGHGDVETKTRSQLGFLLSWDSPPQTYVAGAFPLYYLQEVISTLSLSNKSKIMVITDACRSGKLAGSQVGGAQATSANLARQFSNEIRILSCQPNEFSIEGEQWGGGRGAFSYHLIDGLSGMADQDKDLHVSLRELERYLEDHVTPEVAPQSQIPMIIGNKTEKITNVDAAFLEKLLKSKAGQSPVFASVDKKGLTDQLLEKADSSALKLYKAYRAALAQKSFFAPEGQCVETYYAQIMARQDLAGLHAEIKRDYAAALQDESQQALNAWLKSEGKELSLSRTGRLKKYAAYPKYLERAAQLLGPEHYMYRNLLGRKALFEGFIYQQENLYGDARPQDTIILKKYRESLEYIPEAPHTYYFMARHFGWNLNQLDSAHAYTRKAAELAPEWPLPDMNLAHLLTNKYKKYPEAKVFLDKAFAIDPNSALNWNTLGVWHWKQNQLKAAAAAYQKTLALDSNMVFVYNNLGLLYMDLNDYPASEENFKKAISLDPTNVDATNSLAWLYISHKEWKKAEPFLHKASALDPNDAYVWNNLGSVYLHTNRRKDAEKVIVKSLELDSTNAYAYHNLGQVYDESGQSKKAETQFLEAVRLAPKYAEPYIALARISAVKKQNDQAYAYLQLALENGYKDEDSLKKDAALSALLNKQKGKELMQKYF